MTLSNIFLLILLLKLSQSNLIESIDEMERFQQIQERVSNVLQSYVSINDVVLFIHTGEDLFDIPRLQNTQYIKTDLKLAVASGFYNLILLKLDINLQVIKMISNLNARIPYFILVEENNKMEEIF